MLACCDVASTGETENSTAQDLPEGHWGTKARKWKIGDKQQLKYFLKSRLVDERPASAAQDLQMPLHLCLHRHVGKWAHANRRSRARQKEREREVLRERERELLSG